MLAFIALITGLIILGISAESFIEGAASLAYHLKISSLVIGITIVGFGTSAPEMLVSAFAAWQGNPTLAIGNALGSNIVNIGLILGLTAIIAPIAVDSKIIRKELPLLLGISLFMGIILWDKALTRLESIGLLCGLFILIIWTIYAGIKNKQDTFGDEIDKELVVQNMSLKKAVLSLVIGLIFLVLSSRLLVWGAVHIAKMFGVSDLIIGLTIVALGTSLPELAASVVAARKNEPNIAIGNIIGSSMFNLLGVVGIAGLISPITDMPNEVLFRDWSVMLAMTIGLFLVAFGFLGEGRINRWEGVLLLAAFIVYNSVLIKSIILV